MVLAFGAFQLLATGLFCISELLWGTTILGQVYAVSLLFIFALLLYFRRNGDISRTSNALMAVLFLSVAAANFGSGGQTLGANIALPTLVLVGVLVLSSRGAIALTILVVLQILFVAWLRRSAIDFPIKPDPQWVKSAIDRVPLFFSLAAALIGMVVQRALRRYRSSLEQAQTALQRTNDLFAAVVEGTHDAIMVRDRASRFVFINRAAANFIGRAPEQIIGRSIDEVYEDAESAARIRAADRRTIEDGETFTIEYELTLATVARHFSSERSPLRDQQGQVIGVIGISRDVTRQRQEELAFRRQSNRLTDLIEHGLGLLCTHDLAGVLLSINPAAAKALDYTPGDLIGRNLAALVQEAARPHFTEYLQRIVTQGEDSGLYYLTTRGGEQRIWEYHNRLYRSPGSEPYVMGNAIDVTERRLFERQLRELSVRDPLTGCYNRRYLTHESTKLAPERSWGCVVVDADHFKQINDTYGHQHGDEVLVAIGRFLNYHARQGDAVIRMGGDEFMVLLLDADAAAVEAAASRIRAAAEAEAPCGISIGHAVREGTEPLEKTIDRADKQLYRVRVAVRSVERRSNRRDRAPDQS